MRKLLILFIALLFGGCSAVQLNDMGIVQGIAFDKAEQKQYKMTNSMISTSEKTYENYSAEGNTVSEAASLSAGNADKDLFFGQNLLVIISDKFAKDGIKDIVNAFYQSDDKRSSEQLVICKGSAESALQTEAITEDTPAMSIVQNVNSAEASTYISSCTLHEFLLDSCRNAKTALVPTGYIQTENDKTAFELSSMSVFYDYKLIGELSEDEARAAKWLRKNADGDVFIVSYENNSLCAKINSIAVSFLEKGGGYLINADISFSIEEAAGDKYSAETIAKIEEAAEAEAVRLINCALAAARRLNADFINLSYRFPNADISDMSRIKFSVGASAKLKYLGMAVSPVN